MYSRDYSFICLPYLIWILIFLTLLLKPSILSGQTYYTDNFTIDNGLPSNTIRAIFKDSRGIMWIGTASGLCRFDGRSFTIYNSTNGLAAENIYDITEDNEGNLWIGGMGGGISKYDGKIFTNFSTKEGLISNEVRRVWWSKRFELLLIGTNKGSSVFDGNSFCAVFPEEAENSAETYVVLGFNEGEDYIDLYAYCVEHVLRYYPETNKFLITPSEISKSAGPSCSPLFMENGDTVIGWERKGIQVWNRGIKQAFDSIGQVFHMAADDENNVWIAAWAEAPSYPEMPGGFYIYDGTKVIRLSEKAGITDPGVWTILYDSIFHCIWVGTLHQGLFRMPYPCFEWYEPSFFGLSSIKINDIFADRNNNLWIATSREIIRMSENKDYFIYPDRKIKSAQSETIIKYQPLIAAQQIDKNGSFEKYEELIAEQKFTFPNPYHIIQADLGVEFKVEAGTLYNPALYKQNKQNTLKYAFDTTAICFFSIGEDTRSNIYISGGFGLNRFDKETHLKNVDVVPITGNIWIFAFDDADTLFWSSYWNKGIGHAAIFPELVYTRGYYYSAEKNNAPANPIRMISRGNEIWSASRQGGIYLTIDGRNFAFCKMDSTLPTSINDITFDGPDNIIAGTNNGELLFAKVENEMLKILLRLNSTDGVVGKSIRWVQTGPDRNLYIGTNAGINIINLDTLFGMGEVRIRFFTKANGFCDLNGIRAVVDTSGSLWVATDKHLCRIKHNHILKNLIHPVNILLTGIEINNQPISQFEDTKMNFWFNFPEESVNLFHDQNNLTFYFDALNYLNPDQQQFRYRLLPAIENWSDFSTDRKAAFTTLQPDHYTFEIEAMNLLDQKVVSELTYSFTIRPPYYYTWWFITLSFLLLTAMIVLAFLLRSRQIRKEEKRKADIRLELNSIEMKALKAQMNPHFIFNAINSIQSYVLSNNVDKALYYLSMFAKLVRKTLENSSKDLIPLYEELTYLNYYIELEKMRFEGEFTTETEIDPKLPLEKTMIPPMIIQPFVENAIKHGLLMLETTGHLKVLVNKLDESRYQVTIEDNGIGREKAAELKKKEGEKHRSKGLEITNSRMRLLNENGQTGKFQITTIDLCDNKGNPAGTRVEVTFPLEG